MANPVATPNSVGTSVVSITKSENNENILQCTLGKLPKICTWKIKLITFIHLGFTCSTDLVVLVFKEGNAWQANWKICWDSLWLLAVMLSGKVVSKFLIL